MHSQYRQWISDLAVIVLGSALVAAGLSVFTIPNNIAPGGISGLATAIAHLTHLPIGALSLALNVPILLLGWKKFGFHAIAKTTIATILLSVLIDWFSMWMLRYTKDILLAAVFGGVVCGAGLGILFARGLSTGGTDLIGLMLRSAFPHLSMGTLLLAVDVFVVVFAMLVFGEVEVALYSTVTLFCASKTIDALLQGADHAKVIFIISGEGESIRQALIHELNKGLTVLPARGGLSDENKSMLMTVARRSEVARVVALAKRIDRDVFLILSNAAGVHGRGFKQI